MRAPASTYRLQITENFDLLEAAKTLRYLHELGVDWVYLSPVLAAETGSNHGYDVASHAAVDPSRGRGAGLAALSAEARRLGMGVLVDIVPNHVGVGRPWENEWWWHVLTHGRTSPFASAFDIDWDFGGGKVRLPVVADGDIDEHGDIAELRVLGGELHYRENRFPLAPGTADNSPVEDPNAVLRRQHYTLVNWRDADHDLNYRRFFAVNSLVAVRVEDPHWFETSHAEIARWFEEGLVDGLRIDHPDGLRDPAMYLSRLAEMTKDSYVVVEKILAPGEQLPARWATAGTTGYDALALVDRLFVDPAGEAPLTELEAELRGHSTNWHELTHATKRAVADGILNSETARIARDAAREIVTEIPHDELVDAVAEVLACFPVYRSYLPDGRDHLEEAIEEAVGRRPELTETIRELEIVLLDGATDAAQRFQQTSGMVMAKGVEDCAFYRWGRLTSLNEVGGDPSIFAYTPQHVYEDLAVREAHWSHALSTRTTHDTKRGEDVRARISVLSEVPDLWAKAVRRLQQLAPVPDGGFANILWQAALGAWPISAERLHAFAEKAMREAGEHTTWTAVNEEYEAGVHAAVDLLYSDDRVRGVLEEVLDAVVDPGWSNSLSEAAVMLTMPGAPDIYQGSEVWQLSLVDPDNRRDVDFAALQASLEADAPELVGGVDDPGTAKQALVREALRLRRDQPELFHSFTPVAAEGMASEHVVAFDRGGVITFATRLPVGLARKGGWGETTVDLPLGSYRDAVNGRVIHAGGTPIRAADIFSAGPVALLVALPVRGGRRTRFDVWAPGHQSVTLVVRPVGDPVAEREIPLRQAPDGWWTPPVMLPRREYDYGYTIDDSDDVLPDPRSRRQPDGVHGMSRTVNPVSHRWQDGDWTGRLISGSILYELHVGTFTEEGTLDAAIAHLDHLVDIGVGFVELMPVNAMNGVWNWGYDGVLWYAVHEPYGGPEAYRRFVDACHARGLGVIQDVVYNHLGASGNYLSRFGPYLTEGGIWGSGVDVEAHEQVRRYVIENAIMWFVEFHVDALRLDAIHALVDSSEIHVLEELATEVAALSAHLGRPLTLIAESDLNDTELILPREAGGYGLDAQWNDDFHHALRVALTGDNSGYYVDFSALHSLAKVFEKGFFYDGTWSTFRGRDHGRPVDTDRFPAWRLLAYTQNHDQVGNRARGDRLAEVLDDDQLLLGAMLMLGSPFTPMLFMGEEWAATSPFPYFSSHPEPDLGRAVTEGRVREFARLGWDPEEVLDPQAPETYRAAVLHWDEIGTGRHAKVLEGYRQLARVRRRFSDLTNPDLRRVRCTVDEDARSIIVERGDVVMVANLGEAPTKVTLGIDTYEVVWHTPTPVSLDGDQLALPAHAGAVLVRR